MKIKNFCILMVIFLLSGSLMINAFAVENSCKESHKYGDWIQVTAPSCNEEGQDMRVCGECGHTQYRDTRAYGVSNIVQVSSPHSNDYFKGKSVVCIGDSITYGSGAKKGVNDYVTVLGNILGQR